MQRVRCAVASQRQEILVNFPASILTYACTGIYSGIARAPTTSDAFNAIAEPRRRALLDQLRDGESDVTKLVDSLGWPQAVVSKHLGVLRSVELVTVRAVGRRRLYRVNAEQLKAVHDWVKGYERIWVHQLDRIKTRAESAARNRESTT